MLVPGYYTTTKKTDATTPPSPMDADVTFNLGQTLTKVKEKVQDGSWSRANSHEVSQPFIPDLACNVKTSVIRETQVQTQSTQDNNCGANFVFKSVLNSKPFTDTLQQEFELHSTTINNQSVAPMDIQGFNAQLKEIDLELEKYDNCEAKKFISRKHRTRANKLDARHDNPSEACDCQTMARVPTSSVDMLRVLQTWT